VRLEVRRRHGSGGGDGRRTERPVAAAHAIIPVLNAIAAGFTNIGDR